VIVTVLYPSLLYLAEDIPRHIPSLALIGGNGSSELPHKALSEKHMTKKFSVVYGAAR
jgi:hypothetical protein